MSLYSFLVLLAEHHARCFNKASLSLACSVLSAMHAGPKVRGQSLTRGHAVCGLHASAAMWCRGCQDCHMLCPHTVQTLFFCRLSEERPLNGFAEVGDEQGSLRLPSLGQSAQRPRAPVLRTSLIIAIW